MSDDYTTRAEREFGVISGDELTADAVSDILAGRTFSQLQASPGGVVDAAQENLLEAALELRDHLGKEPTDLAAFIKAVDAYRLAMENH